MSHGLRADAFDVIRQAMKARQMTYAQLGEKIGLSEPSIKRLFGEKDCKLSRLFDICDLLDIDVGTLFDLSKRNAQGPITLSVATEAKLASDPSLFHFFILLRETETSEDIRRRYQLSPEDIFLYGYRLEKLGLAKVDEAGMIRLMVNGPIQFRPDGPLSHILKRLNAAFLTDVMARPASGPDFFTTIARKMTRKTFDHLSEEFEALRKMIGDLSRQDQMLLGPSELETYKLTLAWGMIDYPKLLKIEPNKPEISQAHQRSIETG